MRRLVFPVVVLLLAGCSSSADATPSPSPTTPANAEACYDFVQATKTLAGLVTDDGGRTGSENIAAYQDAYEAFDDAALTADGDVKSRLGQLVKEFPDPPQTVYVYPDAYFSNVQSVYRACTAAGYPNQPTVWR